MMLQAASPPPQGSYIEIFRASHTIVARVVWARERRFGIQTQDRLNVAAIVNATAPRSADGERRSANRPVRSAPPSARTLSELADRNRWRSRVFEFSCLLIFGMAGAGMLASAVYDVMAHPFHKIDAKLDTGR